MPRLPRIGITWVAILLEVAEGVEGFEVGVNDKGTEDKDEEDVEDVTTDSLSRR